MGDFVAITQWLLDLRERFKMCQIPTDPYQAWKLISELEDLEFEAFQHRQGFISMTGPMKETERLIRRGAKGKSPALVHDGNPAMRWMMANVSVKTDPAGNIKADKEKSADRIDGPVAMIMAIGRAVLVPEDEVAPDVYWLGRGV